MKKLKRRKSIKELRYKNNYERRSSFFTDTALQHLDHTAPGMEGELTGGRDGGSSNYHQHQEVESRTSCHDHYSSLLWV
ncbi:hypothetical protein E2C01_027141 [Portunus trituberculatus]|uniref:Uncharacterized protein n=1 Tax=Portunus trituberculatus TaxID=210409 RepID=A0A5B7EKV4_PORTR|nr:hypothetical protein [Portunus trituberculatus]